MKVDWNVSHKLQQRIEEIKKLHAQGLTYKLICQHFKIHKTNLFALLAWDKKMRGGENKHEQTKNS